MRCRQESGARSMVHRGAFPGVGTELVRHCHFTGKAPEHSSDPLRQVANLCRVMGQTRGKGLKLVHRRDCTPFTPSVQEF